MEDETKHTKIIQADVCTKFTIITYNFPLSYSWNIAHVVTDSVDFRKLSWIYYYLFTMLGVVLPGFTTCCIYYAFCMNNACSMYMLSKAALSVKDNQDCFQILSNYIPSFIYLFCIECSSFYFLFYTHITCVQSVVHNIFKKKYGDQVLL